jgi:ATP-dependent RNA helicase DHX29
VAPKKSAPSVPTAGESDQSDVYVSDLDSDLELDALVPTYLKIKGKLYEIDPQLVDSNPRKPTKGAKSKKSAPIPTQSPAVRKLLSQLHQITSDALFDEDVAEAQWPAKRNQIAQNQAEKRQQKHTQSPNQELRQENAHVEPAVSPEVALTPPAASQDAAEDEVDLLGGMFSAVPDQTAPTDSTPDAASAENVVLRDFGKVSGVSPRKVLEEAVRSRLVDYTTS